MPNQPHATSARSKAGRFAPVVPNEARHKTGNGIPYCVPAWAFRTMGIKTIKLPRKTVRMASHQFMPPPIREDASMYVGIHADIEIHKAAKLATPHLLRSHETGARSSLYSEPARAASSADAFKAGMASIGLEFRVPSFEFLDKSSATALLSFWRCPEV